MQDVTVCKECGVPETFYQAHLWLNNGDIVQSVNQRVRLGFIECEMLDPLFNNVGDIIGMPIEQSVISISSRGTKVYLDQIVPENVQKMLREHTLDPQPFVDSTMMFCQLLGLGKYEFMGMRHEKDADDYAKMRILKPFSLPEAAGYYSAAVSVFAEGEHSITYEEIAPELYEFTSRQAEYSEVLKEAMVLRDYHHKDGDIELERCQTCDSPKAFAEYQWHLDEGLIVNENTGRRMAILGPELLDRLFEALEAELGETIPDAIVEAQRRIIKSGISTGVVGGEEELRTQLALRGMGNLQEMKMSPRRLLMRINNASGYYMIVGMVQGLFELTFDKESTVKWELSKEGDLQVEVIPSSKKYSYAEKGN